MVVALISATSLPLVGALWSLLAARSLGDGLFLLEVLAPAALTFAAGNLVAFMVLRSPSRRSRYDR